MVDFVPRFETGAQLGTAHARGYGKRADVVLPAAAGRGDIVGQRAKVFLALPLPLLTKRVESRIADCGLRIRCST